MSTKQRYISPFQAKNEIEYLQQPIAQATTEMSRDSILLSKYTDTATTESTQDMKLDLSALESCLSTIGLTALLSAGTKSKQTNITLKEALNRLDENLRRAEQDEAKYEKEYVYNSSLLDSKKADLVRLFQCSKFNGDDFISSSDSKISETTYKLLLIQIQSISKKTQKAYSKYIKTISSRETIEAAKDTVATAVESQINYISILDKLDKDLDKISNSHLQTRVSSQSRAATNILGKLTTISTGNDITSETIRDVTTENVEDNDVDLSNETFQKIINSCKDAANVKTATTLPELL